MLSQSRTRAAGNKFRSMHTCTRNQRILAKVLEKTNIHGAIAWQLTKCSTLRLLDPDVDGVGGNWRQGKVPQARRGVLGGGHRAQGHVRGVERKGVASQGDGRGRRGHTSHTHAEGERRSWGGPVGHHDAKGRGGSPGVGGVPEGRTRRWPKAGTGAAGVQPAATAAHARPMGRRPRCVVEERV